MLYNTQQFYTPPLRAYEFNERALIIDTETVGSGGLVEIIEIAFGDTDGNLLYQSLVQPLFNPLPPPSKHKRFDRAELAAAPEWLEVWPHVSALIENKLLIAYNAAFDRRALAATCSRYRQRSAERGWRCAMPIVKESMGTRKSVSLNDACTHYGLEAGCHRAGRDVLATYRLLKLVLGTASQSQGFSKNTLRQPA